MRTPIFSRMMLPAVLVMALIFGCERRSPGASRPSKPLTPPSTQPQSFVGTLRGDMTAIGGETGGWVLAGDGATGRIELDVSNVRGQAKVLEGQRASVSGRMTDRKYVERGTVRVLVVEQIKPAPLPGK